MRHGVRSKNRCACACPCSDGIAAHAAPRGWPARRPGLEPALPVVGVAGRRERPVCRRRSAGVRALHVPTEARRCPTRWASARDDGDRASLCRCRAAASNPVVWPTSCCIRSARRTSTTAPRASRVVPDGLGDPSPVAALPAALRRDHGRPDRDGRARGIGARGPVAHAGRPAEPRRRSGGPVTGAAPLALPRARPCGVPGRELLRTSTLRSRRPSRGAARRTARARARCCTCSRACARPRPAKSRCRAGRSCVAAPRSRAQLALLPQSTEDPFPGTVLDTALVGRHPHLPFWQWEGERDRAIARGCLAEVDLAGLETRDVTTLSGGERRRLAVAAVLAQDRRSTCSTSRSSSSIPATSSTCCAGSAPSPTPGARWS